MNQQQIKSHRHPIKGKVVAISKDATTVKVEIPRVVPDKTYGKYLHRHTTLNADMRAPMTTTVGAWVEVLPCRKIAKTKSWKVVSSLPVHSFFPTNSK